MANKYVCLYDGSASAHLTLYKMLANKKSEGADKTALFVDFGQMSCDILQEDHVSDMALSCNADISFAVLHARKIYQDTMSALASRSINKLADEYGSISPVYIPDMIQRAITYDIAFRNFRKQASDEHLFIYDGVVEKGTCQSRSANVSRALEDTYDRQFVHINTPVADFGSEEECAKHLDSIGYSYDVPFCWNCSIVESTTAKNCKCAGKFMLNIVIPTVRNLIQNTPYRIHEYVIKRGGSSY